MLQPPTTPKQGFFYLHAFKESPGETLTWVHVLPAIIRNSRELHAAAVLCANSNVVGAFWKCNVSIMPDCMHIQIDIEGKKSCAKQYIPINDIEQVTRALPKIYGTEALGNPMSGVRLTISTADRSYVLYALSAAQQLEWYRWIEFQVDRRKLPISKDLAQPYVEKDEPMPGPIVTVTPHLVPTSALQTFELQTERPDYPNPNAPKPTKLPDGDVKRGTDSAVAQQISQILDHSPSRRGPPLPLNSCAAAALPELRLIEGDPDEQHLKWRFPEILSLFGHELEYSQMEEMRKYIDSAQQTIGHWSEIGQAPPVNPEEWDGKPVLTTRKRSEIGDDKDKHLIGKIPTAREVLGQIQRGAPSAGEKEVQQFKHLWHSPSPWIAFDFTLPLEVQLHLLWKLSQLHIEAPETHKLDCVRLPEHTKVTDVPVFWSSLYQQARDEVGEAKESLHRRLGIRRIHRPRADQPGKLFNVAHRQPKQEEDPLGLDAMQVPAEVQKPQPKVQKKKKGLLDGEMGTFMRYLM